MVVRDGRALKMHSDLSGLKKKSYVSSQTVRNGNGL